MSGVLDVTDQTFNKVVNSSPVVLIDCWAPWCGPCRIISPVVDELAFEYSGRVVFGKLNVDENKNTPTELGIMSIPTLLLYANGKLVERIVGSVQKSKIKEKLDAQLKNI